MTPPTRVKRHRDIRPPSVRGCRGKCVQVPERTAARDRSHAGFLGKKEKKKNTRAEGESGVEESRSPVPPSLPRVLGGRETRRGERQQGPPGAAEERSSSPSSRGAEDATRLQSSQTTFSSVHFKEASDYVGAVYPEGIL